MPEPAKNDRSFAVAIGLIGTVLICSVALNLFLLRRFSSNRVLKRASGKSGKGVTVRQYRDALEEQYGRETLRRMVLTHVIETAARKAGVYPSDTDIDAYASDLARMSPFLYEVQRTQAQGSETLLRQEMASLLALENLRLRGVSVTPEEMTAWWRSHRGDIVLPARVRTIMVATPAHEVGMAARARAMLAAGVLPYVIAKEAQMRVVGVDDFEPDWSNMPPSLARALNETIFRMKPGAILSVSTPDAIYTIRLVSRENDETAAVQRSDTPPPVLRPRVERMVRLAKAPVAQRVLVALYKEAKITYEVTPYSAYFSDLENAAAGRERGIVPAASTDI